MDTAVLSIIFNRADTFQRTFKEIRKIQPKMYYIAGDGPRDNVAGEKQKCEEARKIIEQIDWDCEVKTLFQDKNLGCREGVKTALDWFFSDAGEGIVLEDDCLPDPTFFGFCSEMLDRYRDDKRIMCITGDNYQNKIERGEYSYYFSQINHCWGWASWNRAWRTWHDANFFFEKVIKEYNDFTPNSQANKMWVRNFTKAHNGEINTWDYTWQLANIMNHGLTITPQVNLVENIGFGLDATHTKEKGLDFPSRNPIGFPLKHPSYVIANHDADNYVYKNNYGVKSHNYQFFSLLWRIPRKIFWKLPRKIFRLLFGMK